MRGQSTAWRASRETDTAHYVEAAKTSDARDVQRHVIQRIVEKIPRLIPTARDETSVIPTPTGETAATGEDDWELPKVIKMPRILNLEGSGESFAAVQEWEGLVTEIGSDVFVANLVDITAQANEANEQAEIPIEDVQEQDRHLFKVGAIFRWVVGYHRTASGTKTRGSRIHFRTAWQLEPEAKIPDLVFENRAIE
jgi:hypothetical protein